MENRKIVLIGCGAVGVSTLVNTIQQHLAEEYVLIDINERVTKGNVMDLQDMRAALDRPFKSIKYGTYEDCKDANIVIITAGRPQKEGETRLEMVADNAKIIKNIALEVKKSGFNGITIIASNPVDIMTTIYQKVTNYDIHKVIGSGTILDTMRLRNFLAEHFDINPSSVQAYVIGEHGDSSLIPWSAVTIANKSITVHKEEGRITDSDLTTIHKKVINCAYEIINHKRATFYGIAAALTYLIRNILEDQNTILIAGGYLQGEYNHQGFYVGVPVIVNKSGWKKVITLPLTKAEQKAFDHSVSILQETLKTAYKAIE